ncbi:unnamed protein product [Toxocara canis]|uniref:Protein-serine/threonine phosphatase n=1 Tax=Toxocara canis TaxID=6265 RepID=A0A183V1X4_TOXCA|nr:unnamed protein product [Toxocara canis]
MRTPSRDVYNLFLAQNFLSSVSQHGSSEGTATRRFPKQRSFSRRKERTPAEFDETKCAHNTTVEKVVPSKQVYGAFSPASAQKEASTSSSLLLVNDEASLPLLPVGGYPLDGHVSGAGRTDTGDTDASTHLTRHASCSAAAFVRSSSSVSTSDVEPAGKRAVVKKLRGKKNVEDVLLLRADSSAGPATVLKKGEEVSSSGMQFTFLKRWRAFTKNGSEERVRRLSCVSADAADIRPIDFRDVQVIKT